MVDLMNEEPRAHAPQLAQLWREGALSSRPCAGGQIACQTDSLPDSLPDSLQRFQDSLTLCRQPAVVQ